MPARGDIATQLEMHGLLLLGGFHPTRADSVPPLASGGSCQTVLLIGNAGPAMWRRFARDTDAHDDSLDAWTAERLSSVAADFGAEIAFPWQRPYLPFQRWCRRTGAVFASPIGIDIHLEYGLWWGVRGALLFADTLKAVLEPDVVGPCESCLERPCLETCPVDAFGGDGYDVEACTAHLSTSAGTDCIGLGCRARRACPVGTAYRYEPEQAQFHMKAFVRSRKGSN